MPLYDVAALLSQRPPLGEVMNPYSLTEADMRVALALFAEHGVKTVLEFGVNEGATAKQLLRWRPAITHYVGVDLIPALFPERGIVPKVAGQMAAEYFGSRLHTVLVDGTASGFHTRMKKAMRTLGLDYFDAVIMDADHEEAATQRDTELCAPYLSAGGLMLWHDYNVRARQHDNGRMFGLKAYLDRLVQQDGRQIMFPDQADRDPWSCVSVAWEVVA